MNELMDYPPYMIGQRDEKIVMTCFNKGNPVSSLTMNYDSAAFLVEQLALHLRDRYLIEITELKEDDSGVSNAS